MAVRLLTPEGMFQPVPYHHVSVATGSRHVHVAGQINRDAEANRLAPGDLAGQVSLALRNTARGLAGAGATFADVVRLRFFVTHWDPANMDQFLAGIENVREELGLPDPLPPLSAIGVDYLFEPDVLVEVEAYAVLD
ncbi:RidA family protein [Promicromonospora thailandica]|uniref:Enamine deaminase RidA, house cleaning of reactive enamine intermediates, YjgF/YER057c/UK114 family n=1 Tax=Promicromonospora thailandica TaxID=765201 RepID=A0A9X2G2A8_9MICO|nr:Rid family hydrolase [Promicromonospora thailandica]MCP2264575.1 Enamine deaminase RidA, house cleaning of reactive enamine intermediates, YjgF/YER057c/UK114 family [Promicromonospora thailandica]BFF20357.1 RidA family protein [Promicromonospora thailandica]